MKQLKCEMCGSTDLVKQDGMFVCQVCGTKYSVEEAKKMMIEGTVEVAGTVKVDNSSFVQKYLANARRAKEKEDWEETEKYYNMVEQNDPDNIEAIFYSAYGKAKSTLIDGDIYKRQAAFKVLKNCISIIDDKYKIERREENKIAINAMADDLAKMICSNFVYTKRTNGYGVISTNIGETYVLFGGLLDAFKESIDNIEKIDDQSYLHEASIRLYKVAQYAADGRWKNLMQKWLDEENRELNELYEKEKQKRVNAYWAEHKEEKEHLDNELKTWQVKRQQFVDEISVIQKKKDNVPSMPQLKETQKKLAELEAQKKELGLFKIKEKKAIQEQIDNYEQDKAAICKQIAAEQQEIEKEIVPIRAELNKVISCIKEIENELTKERK